MARKLPSFPDDYLWDNTRYFREILKQLSELREEIRRLKGGQGA